MLIAAINLKGGVGKSTLAVHLATWLKDRGHTVAFVDADTQTSAGPWLTKVDPLFPVALLSDPGDLLEQLPPLIAQYDYVIADGPGQMAEVSRAILLRADTAIVPCGPSELDLRASQDAIRVIKQAQSIRNGLPRALFICNRLQPRTRLSREILEAASRSGIPMTRTSIQLRQVFADAPGQGTTVWRMGTRAVEARTELEDVFQEVIHAA